MQHQRTRIALNPLITRDGVQAVIWKDDLVHVLTKPGGEITLDAPGVLWRASAEAAFNVLDASVMLNKVANPADYINEAIIFAPVDHIEVLIGNYRCRVGRAKDRNRTYVMAVVEKNHPVIKSFARMLRGALKRIEKVDAAAQKAATAI